MECLPVSVPVAVDDDVLAKFAVKLPVVAKEDAWEVLDPMLNNAVGWGMSAEEVVPLIRRGEKGVEGLWKYVRGFVVEYGVPGALLEGKMAVLLKAIEIRYVNDLRSILKSVQV